MNFKRKNSKVIISFHMRKIVEGIGRQFQKKYNKVLVITEGTRLAVNQAQAMYSNFKKEKGTTKQRKKYINKSAFDEIAKAYNDHKEKSLATCIDKMTATIESQIEKGIYISKHLTASAVDIRTRDLSEEEIEYLIKLIEDQKAFLSYQDKSKAVNPHVHLQLKPGTMFV